MANVFQSLLLAIATATQNELARQIKYFKVENQILRSKLPERITITPQERQRLVSSPPLEPAVKNALTAGVIR
jgi:hypothetical protein